MEIPTASSTRPEIAITRNSNVLIGCSSPHERAGKPWASKRFGSGFEGSSCIEERPAPGPDPASSGCVGFDTPGPASVRVGACLSLATTPGHLDSRVTPSGAGCAPDIFSRPSRRAARLAFVAPSKRFRRRRVPPHPQCLGRRITSIRRAASGARVGGTGSVRDSISRGRGGFKPQSVVEPWTDSGGRLPATAWPCQNHRIASLAILVSGGGL